jgi:hypothetical protein
MLILSTSSTCRAISLPPYARSQHQINSEATPSKQELTLSGMGDLQRCALQEPTLAMSGGGQHPRSWPMRAFAGPPKTPT